VTHLPQPSPWGLFCLGVLCSCLLASGCVQETQSADSALTKFDDWLPGKPDPSDRPKLYTDVLDPTKIFETSCAGCHGKNGNFGPALPLNDPIFLALFSKSQMLEILHNGRPGTMMPSFASVHRSGLTDQQMEALTEGIYQRWGKNKKMPANIPPYRASATGTLAAGREKFAIYCAECHGADGQGGKEAGRINDPAMLALMSDQSLRRIMITGRVDLGMPDFSGIGKRSSTAQPLTGGDIADIVALLQDWRTAPQRALQETEKQQQAKAAPGKAERP